MPPTTNSERVTGHPWARPATSPGASATRKAHPAAKAVRINNSHNSGPSASTKKPKKSKVVHRADITPADDAVPSQPANMRALSKRNITAICDSVSVASRFEGHSRCSAVAPDTTVWTGETDGSIVIRLAPSGVEVSRISQMGRAAVLILLSVNGRMWAGYSDGAIRVFDPSTQRVVHESTQHTAAVYAMCAADGFVYTAGGDWKVHQWEADDLHFRRMYHGHRNNVRCLTTYKDPESGRRYVVSGSDDGTVKIWDASTAALPVKKASAKGEDTSCVATLDGEGRGVLSMLVLEDTAELWVGTEDTAIRVWDLYSMTITAVITAHRTPVVTMQRVEETVWSGSKDGTIVITNRFSKDVVHQATQPPTSSSSSNNSGPQQRFNMSIQPVSRTVVYNIWATRADGAWQCWNFTAPETGAPYEEKGATVAYPESHYLSQSRHRRGSSARGTTTAASRDASVGGGNEAARGADEEDAELRESVARTRRSVAELLTEPAEVTLNNGDSRKGNDDDDDDVPIEAVAESIRNDRAADTQREMERRQAALQKATERAERLRTQLKGLGLDPATVAAAAAAHPVSQQNDAAGSPNTEALEAVSARLEAQKTENAALAAAIVAAKK